MKNAKTINVEAKLMIPLFSKLKETPKKTYDTPEEKTET